METKKTFTIDQANQTLPLVRRIVRDILETGGRLRALAPQGKPAEADRELFNSLLKKMQEYLKEMEALGCSYKDWSFSMGLVDFPARIEGREVLLCWRSDEAEVKHYHGLEDGYAGRKPIPEPCSSAGK